MLRHAETARTRFDSLVVVGAVSVLSFQVVINVGMTVGLVPVTGLPVPFLSYGGSSLIVSMVLIGMSMIATSRKYNS
jgi:rod shape determining protein RodA